MNTVAALSHACPGISIHVIDMVQPPGIGILLIADIDALLAIVAAALAVNSRAETARNARSAFRSKLMPRDIPSQAVIALVSFRCLCPICPGRSTSRHAAVMNSVSNIESSDGSDKCGGIPPLSTSVAVERCETSVFSAHAFSGLGDRTDAHAVKLRRCS